MVQESLLKYLRTQVSNGQPLENIVPILLRQGFSQGQIDEAYVQLGYSKSNPLPAVSIAHNKGQKNIFLIIVIILTLIVFAVLGISAFRAKINESIVAFFYPSSITPLPTPSHNTHETSQTFTQCSDPSHWSSGTSFNPAAYLTQVSAKTCEYNDPFFGYTVQYPANWYIYFSSSLPAKENTTAATNTTVTSSNKTSQPYNVIYFDSQQPVATNSSQQTLAISLTFSKTDYRDITSYATSILDDNDKKYAATILQNEYKTLSIDGQKALQLQYNVDDTVGIDTKFIHNGILYDVTFNGANAAVINANEQYYINLLNSFTLKSAH